MLTRTLGSCCAAEGCSCSGAVTQKALDIICVQQMAAPECLSQHTALLAT